MRRNPMPSFAKGSLSAPCLALGLALAAGGCANTAEGEGGERVSAAAPAPQATTVAGSPTGAGIQTGANTANMAANLGVPAYSTPTPAPGAVSANAPPRAEGVPEPELLPPPPSSTPAPTPTPTPAPTQAAATPAPAAPPAPATPAATPAVDLAAGRQIFGDWACGACHVLADAGGTGHIGPALDGNARLTVEAATRIITNGQGAMPGFGGQLTDEEIATLSAYIVQAKR